MVKQTTKQPEKQALETIEEVVTRIVRKYVPPLATDQVPAIVKNIMEAIN
jgi:hypothetical protein